MMKAFFSVLWALLFISLLFVEKINPFVSSDNKRIDFFCWGDTLDPTMIDLFEKQTGIKVVVHPFSSNEELVVKLKATKGRGYDLICCSDYAIRILKDEHLLSPLDKTALTNISEIEPFLLNHSFDPDNLYSVPFEWEPYVFVTFDETPRSLTDLFKPKFNEKVVMTPDPVEAVAITAHALFGKKESLSLDELHKVKEQLKLQRRVIEAYADHRARYLIETRNVDVAFIRSGFAKQIKDASIPVYIHLPSDHLFMNIENLAITASTSRKEIVHQFINFLISEELQKIRMEIFPTFPSNMNIPVSETLASLQEEFSRRNDPLFFHYLTSEEEIRDLWVSVKGD